MMKIEAVTDEPKHVMTIAGSRIHARPLRMSDAINWSREAMEVVNRYNRLNDGDYEAVTQVMADMTAAIRDYPRITDGIKNDVSEAVWDEITREQVQGVITVLLDMNDPFMEARKRRAEAEAQGLKLLATLPPEKQAEMLSLTISQQSGMNSGSTRGQ